MPSWKRVIVSGSNAALNSLTVTNGITGSLFGTASWANNATTASYALTAGSTAAVAGTTNYVSKFTSGTTIGNSLIYDNGTNVGVNTTSPISKFTVAGLTTLSNQINSFGNITIGAFNSFISQFMGYAETSAAQNNTVIGDGAFYNNTTGSNNVIIGSGAGAVVGPGGSPPVTSLKQGVYLGRLALPNADNNTNEIVIGYFTTGLGSNTVVIGNDNIITTALKGNVGIGTTSPSTKLHVSGAGAFGGIIYPDYNTDTGTYIDGATVNQLKLYADSYLVGFVGGSERYACSTSQFYTSNSTSISSGDRLYITTVDNAASDTDKFLVLNGTEVEYRTGTQLLSDIGGQAALTNPVTGTGANGRVAFWTGTTSQSSNANFFWDNSNGRLGIGTSSPTYKFEVSDGTRTAVINPNSSLDGIFIGVTQAKPLIFGTNDEERMRITSAGNVGIGTSSPSQKLDVYGVAVFGTNTNRYTTIGGSSGTMYTQGESGGWAFGHHAKGSSGTDRGGFGWLGNSDGISYYYIGAAYNTATMYITSGSTGAVGIGTYSPLGKLHVAEANRTFDGYGNINVFTTNTAAADIGGSIAFGALNSTGGTSPYVVAKIQGIKEGSASSYNGALILGTTAGSSAVTERMRITSAGNVGIGTSSPSAKLHVAGVDQLLDDGTNGRITLEINSGQNDIYSTTTAFGGWKNLRYTANDHYFRNGGTEVMRLTGGNVGIGTTTLNSKFTVYKGSQSNTVSIANSAAYIYGADIGLAIGQDNGSGGYGTWLQSVQTGGTSFPMTINPNGGNVTIGALSTSAYKLNVNGDTNVIGTLTATVKSFIIDHPTKEGKKLQYGVLEGPEHSVYVRGKLTNNNTITLPDHWTGLVHEDTITVNLTPIGKRQDLWVETVSDTTITVGSDNEINCFYTVFAERKDIEKLVTEFDK